MAKPFAWSWSVLDMYRTCPKKYYHIKVAKDAKDEDSAFAGEGKDIHDAIFKRLIHDVPLPLPMRPFEAIVAPYGELPGEKHGEMKLALNQKFEPRDFFARDVWVRAILDFLVINGNRALLIDWKTGKPKDDVGQLKLAAAILSRYMPEIEKFTCAYVWVKHPDAKPTTVKLEKRHMREVWIDCYEELKDIQDALKTTTFPASENPLCKWCPVTQCPHNKKGT